MNFVFLGVEPVLIGRAVGESGLHATARHPHRESVRIVIATVAVLGHRGSSKLATPDDQRFLEHSTVFQVGNQGGDAGIDLASVIAVRRFEVPMLIPLIGMGALDESNPAFTEPTS